MTIKPCDLPSNSHQIRFKSPSNLTNKVKFTMSPRFSTCPIKFPPQKTEWLHQITCCAPQVERLLRNQLQQHLLRAAGDAQGVEEADGSTRSTGRRRWIIPKRMWGSNWSNGKWWCKHDGKLWSMMKATVAIMMKWWLNRRGWFEQQNIGFKQQKWELTIKRIRFYRTKWWCKQT